MAVLAPAAPATQTGPTTPYQIVGDRLTILDMTSPVTVNVDEMRAALDRVHTAPDRASAQAILDTLPLDLGSAIVWELTHGVESDSAGALPPEEDVDRAGGTDPEPPVEVKDPEEGVRNIAAANLVAPETVCTYYYGRDTRQMNSLIFRLTLYKFHMRAAWRGCDSGVNNPADEGLDAYYTDLDPFFTCTDNGDLPSQSAGPYGAPLVRFRVSGQCFQGITLNGKEYSAGKNHPTIDNEYDWAGQLRVRKGSAH